MARKPCAQNVPQLQITELNCGCKETRGRFSRIARNAILPFYYDCSGVLDPENNLDNCKKIFYIKNPKYFAGTAKNNPGSMVTQAMRYSHLARTSARHIDGRRKSIIVPPKRSCLNIIDSTNWYKMPPDQFYDLQQTFLQQTTGDCTCVLPWGFNLTNTSNILRNV